MEKSVPTDVNAAEPSLWNFIGQIRSIETLKLIYHQYFNDQLAGRDPSLPSILLYGNEGLGKRAMAKCFSDAMGNINFKEVLGNTLGMGDRITDFFEGQEHTTYFINNCDHLSLNALTVIYKILREEVLYITVPFEKEPILLHFPDGLLILSSTNQERVSSSLLRSVDIHCHLIPYSSEELFLILKQRCQGLCWKYKSDKVLKLLVHYAQGNAGRGMKLLQMGYWVMRSKDENVLTPYHINRALLFLEEDLQRAIQIIKNRNPSSKE